MSGGRRRSLLLFLVSLLSLSLSSSNAAFNLSTISFDQGYTPLFADFNIKLSDDSRSANLHLNRYAGSGFISAKYYDYGFFSARIKLPGNHTAGVVVAFYTSNGDVWEKHHDELDIEFLGNVKGKPWRFQTNMYGNGSTSRGREERYTLWFDPTQDFHQYSILWTRKNIMKMERGRGRSKRSATRGRARHTTTDGEAHEMSTSIPSQNPQHIQSAVGGALSPHSPHNQTPLGGSFIPNPPFFPPPNFPHMQTPMGGSFFQNPPYSYSQYAYPQYGTPNVPRMQHVGAEQRPPQGEPTEGPTDARNEHPGLDSSSASSREKIRIEPDGEGFYVDHVPIREVTRNEAMGGDYPSKPMSLYATIWDASSWATDGGKYPVKYEYEPFVSEFTDFVLEGCPVDPIEQISAGSTISASASACSDKKAEIEAKEYSQITPEGRKAMKWFRENYMYYSHCYDTVRYPVPLPECVIVPSERAWFKETGRLMKFGSVPKQRQRRKRGKGRKHQKRSNEVETNQGQADM